MEIIGLTVCVKYHNILKHCIQQNSRILTKWYIITCITDLETINMVNSFCLPNVEILLFDNFYGKRFTHRNKIVISSFNKGGSLRFGQNYINENHPKSNILILDADILLPTSLLDNIPKELNVNTIYGARRNDYWTLSDFINDTNPHYYELSPSCVGYFQLYSSDSNNYYDDSYNCSRCDAHFTKKFKWNQALSIFVKHLGRDGVNWNGILNETEFI